MNAQTFRPLIRTYVGVSLDGFLSFPSGLTTWEAAQNLSPTSHGIEEFMSQCTALIMGRTVFDQGFPEWENNWPYGDKKVYVLTSSPLREDVPPTVIASQGGPQGLLEQVRSAGNKGDIQLLGGAKTIQTFLDLGAIDRLGVCILPVLLGAGIPLFRTEPRPFSEEAWIDFLAKPEDHVAPPLLKLDHHRVFPDGAIELVYRREN